MIPSSATKAIHFAMSKLVLTLSKKVSFSKQVRLHENTLLKMENVVNPILPNYDTGLHGQSAAKVLGDPQKA